MKKTLLYALLLCSGVADAFPGSPRFATKIAEVEHTLALSHWVVDGKGIPSFDYVYEQRAGTCHFRLAGHAVGVTETVDGKVELAVFNPQDDKGREMPQIVTFDSDDATLSLPYKGTLRGVGFVTRLDAGQRAHACAKGNDEGLRVHFGK